MASQFAFPEALLDLDLGPLTVRIEEIQPPGGADAFLSLGWEGDDVPFAAEYKDVRDLRTLRSASVQARRWAAESARQPLVVVPYLSDDWLAYLRAERMNGIDLSGNGCICVPKRWSWFQKGSQNRFRQATRSREPYRGKSALVGRVLLSQPRFRNLADLQSEIQRRQGSLSLGQISKVLTALQEDLVVEKADNGVRLVAPERLLDSLVDGYGPPTAVQQVDLKADVGPELFATIVAGASQAKARVAGYDPARFVIAPEPYERIVVYIEPRGFTNVSLMFQSEVSRRFANISLRAVEDPTVFFDTVEEGGFRWCSRLETYLQLMQGGKREQEVAGPLRVQILGQAGSSE